MSKLVLDDITQLGNQASALALLNSNYTKIETALENTLSRDGTTPNQMLADLDMNSRRVINAGVAINDNDLITKGQVDDIAFAGATVNVTVTSALVTPKAIGCPEDGTLDDAAVIQSYMTLHPEGGAIHFNGGKTYRFHDRLEVPSNWTLNGNGAKIRLNSTAGIFMGGTYQFDADTDKLSSNVSAGGNTLTLISTDLVTRYPNNAKIQILDGDDSEYVTVSSTNSGANSILITGTLENAHTAASSTLKLLMASPLYANLSIGTNYLDIPDAFATYFSVGDYIQISDSVNNFETNRIRSIDTSPLNYTRITLYFDVSRAYTTANLSYVYAIDPCVSSKVENFVLEYVEAPPSTQVHAVECFFSAFCRVRNVYVLNGLTYGNRGNGIRDYKSLGTVVDNCIVADPLYYAAGEGYGITSFYSTQGQVSNSLVRGCRHGFLWQDSTDCQINQCLSVAARISDFELHGNNEVGISMNNIKAIPGNLTTGDSTTHTAVKLLGGRNITVNNLQVRNWNRDNGYIGVYIEPSAANIMLTDLHIDGAWSGVAGLGLNTTATSSDITIKDSKFSNCTWTIDLSCDNVGGSAYIMNNIFIQGNTFYNCTENITVKRCSEVKITDNVILGKTVGDTWAIVLDEVSKASVVRNLIEKTDKGVYLIDSPDCIVAQNTFVALAESVVGNDGGGNTNLEWLLNTYLRITSPSFSGLGTTVSAEVDF
jgi:hypothetical protein